MNPRLAVAAAASAIAMLAGSGCAVVRGQQQVGSYVDDAAITAKVKAKLAESEVASASSITVETLKGEVQLAGFAKSYAERDTAERLARETKGVTAVHDDIVVEPGKR